MSDYYELLKDIPDFGYFGELDTYRWGSTSIGKSRDSSIIGTTNFDGISKTLMEEFPDSFETMRAGHWGVGWVEHLLVDTEDEAALARLKEIADALEDYPIWDDEAVSAAEMTAEEEDYDNNIHSELTDLWEKDWDNIPFPEGHWVQQKAPNVGDGPDDVLYTTDLGGYFKTEGAAEDFIIEELKLEVPEFPDHVTKEQGFAAYRIAMSETNQYWAENDSPVMEALYEVWKANLPGVPDEKEDGSVPPKE